MKKKTKKEKKIVVDEIKTPEYKATVRIFGKNWIATGKTISEALAGLTPMNCKGKSILTVEKGEIKKDRILMPMQTFRLFNSHGLMREVALKNTSLLFGF